MQASRLLSQRVTRVAIAATCLALLLALDHQSVLRTEPAATPATAGSTPRAPEGPIARKLILSEQARRFLTLQYRSYSTEFMGCMIGDIRGSSVVVRRIAPADVDPARSGRTYVVPKASCEQSGWSGTIGMIHSHPGGERCYYYFPGTQVPASDAASFARQRYPVDAIMCGDRVVWVGRDMVERQLSTVDGSQDAPATAGR